MIDSFVERLPRGMQQFVNEIVLERYPEPARPFNKETATVVEALEDPRFIFRSAKGIAEQIFLAPGQVWEILESKDLEGVLVHSRSRNAFTTRDHYRQTAGWYNRMLDSFAGHIR